MFKVLNVWLSAKQNMFVLYMVYETCIAREIAAIFQAKNEPQNKHRHFPKNVRSQDGVFG